MNTLNDVLASNLKWWMAKRHFNSQMAFAEKANVDQKTISNCLHPQQRLQSVTGRSPSVTLTAIEKMAGALNVPAWVLLRPVAASNESTFSDALEFDRREFR